VATDEHGRLLVNLDRSLSALCRPSEGIHAPAVTLVKQGLFVDRVCLLTSGIVKLSSVDSSGNDLILELPTAPFLIGFSSAILEARSSVTISTVTHCGVRHFPANEVRKSLRTDGRLAFDMSRAIARENLSQVESSIETRAQSTRARLIRLLTQLNDSPVANSPVGLRPAGSVLKMHEVAKLIAVTPEHLSRLLRALQREGVVRRDGGRIMLTA
jgi:CRP-like cAMP-binding protein